MCQKMFGGIKTKTKFIIILGLLNYCPVSVRSASNWSFIVFELDP